MEDRHKKYCKRILEMWQKFEEEKPEGPALIDVIAQAAQELADEELKNNVPLGGDEEYHLCHFCGTEVRNGYEYNGRRHYLSDCRPDLVKHEIGDTCTWAYKRNPELYDKPYKENDTCYAYQNLDLEWTDKHEHFYKDGPM